MDIYERVVFICPYKDGDFVVKLLDVFYKHNRDVFKIELEDYITILN